MDTKEPCPGSRQHRHESEIDETLSAVSDLAQLLVWEVDPHTREIRWISGLDRIPGHPALKTLDACLEITYPDDRDAAKHAFIDWFDGIKPLDLRHRAIIDGRVVWLRSRGAPLTAGRSRMLGITRDITTYLRQREDAVFLASVQHVLETSADDELTLWNIGNLLRSYLDLDAISFLDVAPSQDTVTLLHRSLHEGSPELPPGTVRHTSRYLPPDLMRDLASGVQLSLSDTANDERVRGQREALLNAHIGSLYCTPYIQAGTLRMLLCASHSQPYAWQEHEHQLLAEVAERVMLRLERTRANTERRRSEDQLRSLFEMMDEAFCIIELIDDENGTPVDYRFLTVNQAFEKHTGWHNAAGKRVLELMPIVERAWLDVFDKVARTRQPDQITNKSLGLEGRWFKGRVFPLDEPTGRHVAILFTDVTEQHQTTHELELFKDRVQRALEIESVGIVFFRSDDTITDFNDAFLRMSGHTSDDIAHGLVRWESITTPDGLPETRRAMAEYVTTNRMKPYENEFIRDDGTRWWGLVAASRINDDEGVAFIIDITASRQAEVEQERLADIVEYSNDAIIRCDPGGRIVDINRAASMLYRYEGSEFIGKNIMDTAPVDRRDEFATNYARMQRGEHVPPWETVRYDKFGRPLQVEIRMSPIRNASGEIVGASGVIRDIAERKRLEQAQEDFLAMASHDLKSPVTVLLGRAQLMRRRKAYDEKSIVTIIDQAHRIERLATDLQHVVHMESGQMEFHPVRTDITELVRNAIDRVQPANTTLEFCTDMPQHPIIGHWDRDRISQVIDNLLSNAVKYSPGGGTITVCIVPTDSVIEIRVTDHGIGIIPAFQQQLFDRFYRADNMGTSQGLGLGLYISRMLVEAHGGDIRVSSTPGKGSTFIVRLPHTMPNAHAAS